MKSHRRSSWTKLTYCNWYFLSVKRPRNALNATWDRNIRELWFRIVQGSKMWKGLRHDCITKRYNKKNTVSEEDALWNETVGIDMYN